MKDFTFNTIEEAIAAIKAGKMVLVTDDEDRENEGDLIMAAQFCTGESINFMAKEARGLICMPADAEIMDKLQFSAMVSHNTDNHETAFSVSIEPWISGGRAMCSRCAAVKAGCWCGPGTRKPPRTCAGWRA